MIDVGRTPSAKAFAGLVFGVVSASSSLGCVEPAVEVEALPAVELAAFTESVQPGLSMRCASPACHGTGDRPLSLYAPGKHRLDPARTFLDEALDADELRLNALRVLAFAQTDPIERAEIITKPQSPADGGTWHGGGTVFKTDDDPDLVALLVWLDAVYGVSR